MVWAVVIAVLLHIFAYGIYKIGVDVLENQNLFLGVCGAYLVVFFISAIAMSYLIPAPGTANISIIPQAWMNFAFAAE